MHDLARMVERPDADAARVAIPLQFERPADHRPRDTRRRLGAETNDTEPAEKGREMIDAEKVKTAITRIDEAQKALAWIEAVKNHPKPLTAIDVGKIDFMIWHDDEHPGAEHVKERVQRVVMNRMHDMLEPAALSFRTELGDARDVINREMSK